MSLSTTVGQALLGSLVACLLTALGFGPAVADPHGPGTKPLVAVTAAEEGKVILLDRRDLTILRTFAPRKAGPAPGPMLVVENAVRRSFYVGNFDRGLADLPMDGGNPRVLDLGDTLIGLALSPDGRLLAVNGARDLTLRLIDPESWTLRARVRYGTPTDEPRHPPLTHGLASTHPVWLPDGSGVLTQDNIHEEVVLIDRHGKEWARRRLRSAVHTFLIAGKDRALALAEGTLDRTVDPAIVVLDLPSLKIVREIPVPLEAEEPAKLHHGALSLDGSVVVVANMGPMHGGAFGRTVVAADWRTGRLLWRTTAAKNAGHVRFLDRERVIVLGHRDPNLFVLEARTGKKVAAWTVPDAAALGHSLAAEPDGSVLILDGTNGRLVRLADRGVVRRSPPLGGGIAEASLPE